jgi:hypothetical protein
MLDLSTLSRPTQANKRMNRLISGDLVLRTDIVTEHRRDKQ